MNRSEHRFALLTSRTVAAIFITFSFLLWPRASAGEPETYTLNGGTLNLEAAIRIALENNHQVKASELEHKEQGWEVSKARSMMLPKLSVDVGYTRVDNGTVRRGNVFTELGRELVKQFAPDQDPNDIRPGAWLNMYGTSLTVTQPIYNGGMEFSNLSMSRALERSAYCNLQDTRGNTILLVKEAYFRILKASEMVMLMEETLSSTREHLHNVRKMMDVGLRSSTDVLRWEVQEASDEGMLLDAVNNLSLSQRLLEEALGVHLPDDTRLVPLTQVPEGTILTQSQAIDEALRSHPALRSLDAQVDASRAGLGMAWSQFRPQVNLVYNLTWETNSTIELDSFRYWSAGLTVRLPLFNSFGDWAELQRSKVQLNRLREMEEGTRSSVETAAVQAYLDVQSSVKKWAAARKGAEHAAENLKSVSKNYEVGFASNLDLIDAQVARTQAKTNVINTLYDYFISVARLDKTTGHYENIQEGLK